MNIFKKIRKKLTYTEVSPLLYTTGLQEAYSGKSVAGGSLRGKHVVVTGGSGGIGLAIAKRYLDEGCDVTITGRSKEKLKSSLERLETAMQGKAGYVVMDQLNPTSINDALGNILEKEEIDIWVNCAGVFTDSDKTRRFRSVDKQTYTNVMNTNLKSVKLICESLAEHWLSTQKKGQIINIDSICGLYPSYGQTPYGLSKIQVASLTRQLSVQYKGKVFFTCVSPGSVATAMGNKKTGDNISSKSTMLTRHIAMPEEIAAVVAFLSCPTGRMVNNSTSQYVGMIKASASETL